MVVHCDSAGGQPHNRRVSFFAEQTKHQWQAQKPGVVPRPSSKKAARSLGISSRSIDFHPASKTASSSLVLGE
jgi:hypothetical protein